MIWRTGCGNIKVGVSDFQEMCKSIRRLALFFTSQ